MDRLIKYIDWDYSFVSPEWLWLLCLLPFVGWFMIRQQARRQSDQLYTGRRATQQQFNSKNRWIAQLFKSLIIIDLAALGLMIMAMARPVHTASDEYLQEQYKNGIDIVMAIDVSASMLAMDFEPNRMEAAKAVAKEFIEGRKGDRIGLVIYAGEAYTACPSTLDYAMLNRQIDEIGLAQLDNGTAIGTGLGTAVARLRDDNLPSKVIILLTDGSNNAGIIEPTAAAELAKAKNIRVYTIGVGSNGEAPTPVITPFGVRYENMPVEIDETTLKSIAAITDGKYFRATDETSLRSIYREIDQLEKRRQLDKRMTIEPPAEPVWFLSIALMLLLLSFLIKRYYFPIQHD